MRGPLGARAQQLFDESGKRISTWPQITALTHRNGLRPSLPEDTDEVLRKLIEDVRFEQSTTSGTTKPYRPETSKLTFASFARYSHLRHCSRSPVRGEQSWNPNPQLRPGFEAIAFRVRTLEQAMLQANYEVSSKGTRIVDEQDLATLCRGINTLLWTRSDAENRELWSLNTRLRSWNSPKAVQRDLDADDKDSVGNGYDMLIMDTMSASATDPVLNAMLKGAKGVQCLARLRRLLIYGDVRGGEDREAPKPVPEPLVDADVTVDRDANACLLCVRYVLHARLGGAKLGEITRTQDERFNEIKVSLFPQPSSSTSGLPRLKSGRRLKKKVQFNKSFRQNGSLGLEERKRMRMFGKWVKCTRFVRGRGQKKLSPAAKLKLYGLSESWTTGKKRGTILIRRGLKTYNDLVRTRPLLRSSQRALHSPTDYGWELGRQRSRQPEVECQRRPPWPGK